MGGEKLLREKGRRTSGRHGVVTYEAEVKGGNRENSGGGGGVQVSRDKERE